MKQKYYAHAQERASPETSFESTLHPISFYIAPILQRLQSNYVRIRLHQLNLVVQFPNNTSPSTAIATVALTNVNNTNMITQSTDGNTTLLHMITLDSPLGGANHYYSYLYTDDGSSLSLVFNRTELLEQNGILTADLVNKNVYGVSSSETVGLFSMILEITDADDDKK